MATYELIIDNAKLDVHCHDEPRWITFRTHGVPDDDLNGYYGLVEDHMCVLDSGIVIVCALSSTDYVIRIWAIDCSTKVPRIGPEAWFNADGVDYYPTPISDDPYKKGFNDLNECVALGQYTFGFTGSVSEHYNSSGEIAAPFDYSALASLFSVDPESLEVTRNHFLIGQYGSSPYGVPDGEATMSRWGNKMVIATDQTERMWIASSDGSYTSMVLSDWEYLSTPVVIGDFAFLFGQLTSISDDIYHLMKVSLVDGSIVDLGGKPEISNQNWSWHGAPIQGGAAWQMVGYVASSQWGPLNVAVWDGATFTVVDLEVTVLRAGFTGGWYSNAADITEMTNGDLLVTYFEYDSRKYMYKRIRRSDLSVIETDQVSNFNEPAYPVGYNYNFAAEVGSTIDDRIVALWCSHTYRGGGTNFGLYMAYENPDWKPS